MKHFDYAALSLLLLGAITLNTLVSCGSGGQSEVTTTSGETGTTAHITEAPEIVRDFGGNALRVYMTRDYIYQIHADEETGDVSNDAIFRRNSEDHREIQFHDRTDNCRRYRNF